jgi:hypothetical protein
MHPCRGRAWFMRVEKETSWRVRGPVKIGDVISIRVRKYKIVNVEPYYSKTGSRTKLITWLGTCVVCGYEFHFQSGAKFWPTATCPEHRGQAPRGKNGGQVEVLADG